MGLSDPSPPSSAPYMPMFTTYVNCLVGTTNVEVSCSSATNLLRPLYNSFDTLKCSAAVIHMVYEVTRKQGFLIMQLY
jgi:hypothetical protein